MTGVAVVSIAGSALMWNHYRDDLAVAWTVIPGFVAVMAAAVSWARAGAGRKRLAMSVDAKQLADAAEGLARAVQQQWRAESDLRRVQDPWPLPVRWVNTPRPVMDYWEAVRGVPGEDEPLDLSGGLDDITEVFARVPSGRLVLLGKGGAGKTVLLMQLVLDLLESWTADEPVPVLLSVGAWDTELPLEIWLVTRLEEEYPGLATRGGSGATLAQELVRADRVLPVLDGLDEIPPALRADALQAANLASARLARLVVSCRTEEYVETVGSGDVLSRAAVIELSPLPAAELQNYLRVTTPPGRAAIWDKVFAAMAAEPDGPLAQALSTPLMAWLARIGYGETNESPDELLDTNADGTRVFACRSMVEERLLDRYVPAVYASHEPQPRYPAVAAQRWLTFLAVHLYRLGTRDLAWWQFPDAVPFFWPGIGLVAGLSVGLIMGLVYRFAGGLWAELVVGLAGGGLVAIVGTRAEIRAQLGIRFLDGLRSVHRDDFGVGLLGGIGAGLAAGFAAGRVAGIVASVTAAIILAFGSSLSTTAVVVSAPPPVAIRLKGRLRQVSRRFAYGVVAGGVIGIGLAIAIDLTIGTSSGPIIVPVFAGVGGLAGGLILGFLEVLSVPNDPGISRSPLTFLRVDRNATAAATVVATLVAGSAAGIAFGLVFDLWGGVAFGLAVGVAAALAVGLGGGLGGAWGRFTLARVPLALTGRTPWTLIGFLEDAHLRGVLRQVGGVYQFRHARLQDRLVAHYLARAAQTGPPASPTTTAITSS